MGASVQEVTHQEFLLLVLRGGRRGQTAPAGLAGGGVRLDFGVAGGAVAAELGGLEVEGDLQRFEGAGGQLAAVEQLRRFATRLPDFADPLERHR